MANIIVFIKTSSRRLHQEECFLGSCSIKKGVLRNFVNFIGKHPKSLFNRVADQETQTQMFSCGVMKFLETGVYEQLLLKAVVSPGVSSN